MKILVTGVAGFIGFHSAQHLAAAGHEIIGIDNLNDYYDVRLKHARLASLGKYENFRFIKLDLADREEMARVFRSERFDTVLHLGAQAGVRYSIDNPFAYIDSNIAGTLTVLEGCRNTGVSHLIYASSSSVYGANTKQPFSIDDRVDSPVSLYAATKKSNELMCYTYSHLFGMPATGLRFFTVYGPWGRPDMAYFKFALSIANRKPIDIYNHGEMRRDFTYVSDIVNGIASIIRKGPRIPESGPPHMVYNLGNNRPEPLMRMVSLLEEYLGLEARKNYLEMQPGDVYETFADISETARDYGYAPQVTLEEGLRHFSEWFLASEFARA